MDVNQQQRLALGEFVSRMLCHPDGADMFPAVLPSGKRHVVVALASDTYGSLLRRVKNLGGAVNVVVGDDSKNDVAVIAFHRSPQRPPSDYDDCEVGPESELGLLIAYLRTTGRPTRVRLASPRYEAELVDSQLADFTRR